MATLTRQRVIMHHSLIAAADSRMELFTESLDEPGPARAVTILVTDYVDMGSPSTITVTIDPGDVLND